MDLYTTPAPGGPTSGPYHTAHPFTEVVTGTVTTGFNEDYADFAALIGAIISVVLLLLICVIGVLLWCLSRHKGSYVTNEMDEDDDIADDDESVGSDVALQSKLPLKPKEEE